MKHRYVALISFACTCATLYPFQTHATVTQQIVLSEISWSGSTLSSADEWIELANISSETINIGLWSIEGILSSDAVLTFPEETILESGATYLIANYAQGDAKSSLLVDPNVVSSSVSIPNSSIAITIKDAEGNIIDTYIDNDAPDYGDAQTHASAERIIGTQNWQTTTTSINIAENTGLGTPGHSVETSRGDVSDPKPIPESNPVEESIIETIIEAEPEIIPDPINETNVIIETEIVIEPIIDSIETPRGDASESNTIPEPEIIINPELEIIIDPELETIIESEPEKITDPIIETNVIIEPVETPRGDVSESNTIPEPEIIIEPITEAEIVTTAIDETKQESFVDTVETSRGDVSESDIVTNAIIEPEPMIIDYNALRITEFVSNPEDGDEWIEFENTGDISLPLEHLTITDASGKKTALAGEIKKGAFYIVKNPVGKLNNSGDSILVTLSDGQLLFSLAYGTENFAAPKKGFSAGLCKDAWKTNLTPSPEEKNICPTTLIHQDSLYEQNSEISSETSFNSSSTDSRTTAPLEDTHDEQEQITETITFTQPTASVITSAKNKDTLTDQKEDVQEKKSAVKETKTEKKSVAKTTSKKIAKAPSIIEISLEKIEEVASGKKVRSVGILIVEPGILGKRTAYLNGVELYFHKGTWGTITEGSQIQITGTWEFDESHRRIKIADSKDIVIMQKGEIITIPYEEAITQNVQDVLVTAEGVLTKKEGERLVFTTSTQSTFTSIDEAKTGAFAGIQAGETIHLTGLLKKDGASWIIIPRTSTDVQARFIAPPQEEKDNAQESSTQEALIKQGNSPWLGGGILTGGLSMAGYWFFRSKKFSFLT